MPDFQRLTKLIVKHALALRMHSISYGASPLTNSRGESQLLGRSPLL